MATDMTRLAERGPAYGTEAGLLVHHLSGALDAGEAGRLAVAQLVETLPHRRVATFSADALIDYRSRRPLVEMNEWVISSSRDPLIALDVVEDLEGASVLVLHGPEPDMRWREFVSVVADIARACGVTMTAGLMGMPAMIPHTRPTFVHRTATDPELIPAQPSQPGYMTLSASMDLYLQSYLGHCGLRAVGLVAGVPYYLSEGEYPASGVALVEHLSSLAGLSLPVGDLEAHASVLRARVDAAVAASDEVGEIVATLEERYDEDGGIGSRREVGPGVMPTGESIAQSLQTFLEQVESRREGENRGRRDAKSSRHGLRRYPPRASLRRSRRRED